jgi:hypothetical protein
MNTAPLVFSQIYPYIKRDDTFVLIDRNNEPTSYEPAANQYTELYDLMNRKVLEIKRFRYGMYDEEDYLAIKIDYDKGEII